MHTNADKGFVRPPGLPEVKAMLKRPYRAGCEP
jgi:hypothetical protein